MRNSALDCGYDHARAQHERLGIPTVVVPIVLDDGTPALYWESFAGLGEDITHQAELQAALAAVCCEQAYEDAAYEFHARPVFANR